MMTLQGMADHRFTSVSLSTNVFLGEIIYLRPSLPLNAKNCCGLLEVLWRGLAAGCHSKNRPKSVFQSIWDYPRLGLFSIITNGSGCHNNLEFDLH